MKKQPFEVTHYLVQILHTDGSVENTNYHRGRPDIAYSAFEYEMNGWSEDAKDFYQYRKYVRLIECGQLFANTRVVASFDFSEGCLVF